MHVKMFVDLLLNLHPTLQPPTVLEENVYNMDETGIMLSALGSLKVLVG
jgi:hypothetical protein